MKILFDTHCWLWWISEPEKFSSQVLDLLKDGDNELLLSAVSSWEITIKYALGKLPLPESPDKFIPPRLERDELTPLSITHTHVLRSGLLPHHHRDPFDRLLVAQAQVERTPLLTADPMMKQYDVEIITMNAR